MRPTPSRSRWFAAITIVVLASVCVVSRGPASAENRTPAPMTLAITVTPSPVGSITMINANMSAPARPQLAAVVADGEKRGRSANQAIADLLTALPVSDAGGSEAPILDDLNVPVLTDLLTYADDRNMSIVDVARLHGSDRTLNGVIDQLGESFPENYLGAVLPTAGSPALHVIFSDAAPPEAVAALYALRLPVELEEGVGLTTHDLDRLSTTAGTALAARDIPCTVYFNLDSREWFVSCDRGATTPSDVAQSAGDLAATAPVSIQVDGSSVDPADHHLRGGGLLDGSNLCTAGFVMIHTDGVKRLSTAGHCAKSNSTYEYSNHSQQGGSTTVGRSGYNYGPDDWGMYGLGGFTPYPVFYYNWGSHRSVSGQQNTPPAMHSSVCHFGRTTGYHCGDYVSSYVTRTYTDGTTVSNLSMVTHIALDHGDSGGPVFSGTRAYGFCSGQSNTYPVADRTMYYEPIWRVLPSKAWTG